LELELPEFDLAVELVNSVLMRHHREELLRTNIAAQGDAKAVKAALKAYNGVGERERKADEQAFLKFAGGGI
jgi:hypothetical protein